MHMATQFPALLPCNVLGIPTEIVRQFLALFATKLSTKELNQFPWFLGHICSTWRSIFLSMNVEFWDSISITFYWTEFKRVKDVLRFFLERNPAAPFSFEVIVYHIIRSDSQDADNLLQIIDMLTDASLRWRAAHFCYVDPEYLLPLKRAKNRLPLLQELELMIINEVHDSLYDTFEDAPSLDVVKLYNLGDLKFNWLNLRVIDGQSGVANFSAAMPQMMKLERFRMGYGAKPTSIILLPNLTTLDCPSYWLGFLEAPALTNLTITYTAPECFEAVLSFLHRSRCGLNITSVIIKPIWPNCQAGAAGTAGVIEILKHMPNITHLDLAGVDIFEQLTVSTNPARQPLAPHMRSLIVRNVLEYDIRPLYNLISSRTVHATVDHCGHNRLRKLTINRWSTPPELIALCKEREVQCINILDDKHRQS